MSEPSNEYQEPDGIETLEMEVAEDRYDAEADPSSGSNDGDVTSD